jgi:hypothetical protein
MIGRTVRKSTHTQKKKKKQKKKTGEPRSSPELKKLENVGIHPVYYSMPGLL